MVKSSIFLNELIALNSVYQFIFMQVAVYWNLGGCNEFRIFADFSAPVEI